jgi:hypothetical protein
LGRYLKKQAELAQFALAALIATLCKKHQAAPVLRWEHRRALELKIFYSVADDNI